MNNIKTPCLIMALESNVGMGRNMEIYYKLLAKSKYIRPVMVYSMKNSFEEAPFWIRDKTLIDIKSVDHLTKDCAYLLCKKPKKEHRTYEIWAKEAVEYIVRLRKIFGEKAIWLLDMSVPELELYMGKNIVQVFHGELFDVGISYFDKNYSFSKYSRIFIYGNLMRDRIVKRLHLKKDDPRFKPIGRVLNDSLYNSTINKSKILNLFGLNPKRKTIIYAPSWESRKIWPIGAKKDDVNNLVKFLEFAKQNRLNVILRPHPISLIHQGVDKSYLNAMDKIKNVYLDDSTKQTLLGPNPSLFVSDVLVTDLSSIAIDFMSLGKPAVFIYPDSRVGDWSKRLPSIKEVLKVSYTVTNFADLFKLVKRLFTKREESFEIDRRKNFVSYALSVSDGNSGKLFRNELENYVKNMPLRNFISSDFVENYLRFSKKKKDINYKQTFQISFKTLKH